MIRDKARRRDSGAGHGTEKATEKIIDFELVEEHNLELGDA